MITRIKIFKEHQHIDTQTCSSKRKKENYKYQSFFSQKKKVFFFLCQLVRSSFLLQGIQKDYQTKQMPPIANNTD